MSARSLFALTFLILGAGFAQASAQPGKPVLSLYVYDSFVAKGGLGPEIFPAFEKKCGCELKVMPSGDGAQLLNRLQIDSERGRSGAQVVVGLDEPTFERAKSYLEIDSAWVPQGSTALHPDLGKLKRTNGFYPYDYGFFAFMADRKNLSKAKLSVPSKLSDLLNPAWKRNVILEDPRTSTPGLAFVLYADQVSGPGFWPKLRTQWLTLAQGWDGAYGLFLRGEAPLVWSYTTSQAYHESHGDSASDRRYQAVLFDEGQPIQIEGASIVKGAFASGEQGSLQRKLAHEFLEYLISPEVQNLIGDHQWMYPARKNAKVPPSFAHVPRPKKIVRLKSDPKEVKDALSSWSKAIEGAN